jgi:hypothetical protein
VPGKPLQEPYSNPWERYSCVFGSKREGGGKALNHPKSAWEAGIAALQDLYSNLVQQGRYFFKYDVASSLLANYLLSG